MLKNGTIGAMSLGFVFSESVFPSVLKRVCWPGQTDVDSIPVEDQILHDLSLLVEAKL